MPQTLLLADDSATIQRVIELTFADQDINVVSVADGDQAIARLEAEPTPDIVLADVGMPGKNGYEVAEYVRRTPRLAHIPVVLLTGAFEPVDQVKAAAVGCDAVLAKPFEPQLVIGRVRELLGRSASADGNSPATAGQAPAAELAPAPPVAVAAESAPRVEDYFDRLDAAFQTLSKPPAAALVAAPPVPDAFDRLQPQEQEPQAVAVADTPAADPKVAPEPVVVPEPVVAPEPKKPEPVAVVAPPEPLEPLERRGPRVLPSIADAFGAILAAEQNALGVRPEWPTPSQSADQTGSARGSAEGNAEVVITDELVDRVARRVLDQLSDRVVRETVASMASDAAERLVKEEIERIKSAIK